MLVDVTRKPLIVFPEECPTSVVVRTIGDHVASGLLMHGTKPREATAQISRGARTLFETRLPLPSPPQPAESRPAWLFSVERVARYSRGQQPKVNILPEPYEVASVYIDPVTGVSGTWRIGVRIKYVEKMKRTPWVVSVIDATTGGTLSTVAVSTLNSSPEYEEAVPLARALKEKMHPSTNAWTRLLDDD